MSECEALNLSVLFMLSAVLLGFFIKGLTASGMSTKDGEFCCVSTLFGWRSALLSLLLVCAENVHFAT